MSDTFVLESAISYWNVDREQVVTLTGLFKLLQEGAIRHADQHNLGSQSMRARGESWILNRIAARIHRYPRYGEAVRLETWSSGIRAFKGYREFRLQTGGELVVEASSLWLYVDVRTKSLVRVPRELAAGFPERTGAVFHPELDKLRLDEAPADSASQEISLRYSDIDSNGHVNNAAYFDYLQTALALTGGPAHPTHVELHFAQEIPPALGKVTVRVARRADGALASFMSGAECFARARLRG